MSSQTHHDLDVTTCAVPIVAKLKITQGTAEASIFSNLFCKPTHWQLRYELSSPAAGMLGRSASGIWCIARDSDKQPDLISQLDSCAWITFKNHICSGLSDFTAHDTLCLPVPHERLLIVYGGSDMASYLIRFVH